VDVPRGRPLRASDHRLLNALADQAAVAFRNAAMEAQLAEHVADLDRAAKKLAESRSRIIAADDAVRQRLEAAIARDVMPRLVELPAQLHHARSRSGGALEPMRSGFSWTGRTRP
jgi:GAF domain-containing protein